MGEAGGALVWISSPSTLVFCQCPTDTGRPGSPLVPTTPRLLLWFLLHCLGLKDAPASIGGPKALKDPVVLLRRSESFSYCHISWHFRHCTVLQRKFRLPAMAFSFKNSLQGQASVNGSGLCSFIQKPDPQTVPKPRILHPPKHSTAGMDRFFFSN